MRDIITNKRFILIMLSTMAACTTDIDGDTDDQEPPAAPVAADEAPSTRASTPELPDGRGEGDRPTLKQEDNVLACGRALQGPWSGGGGWWKYGIYNCNPYPIRAQAFRINGSGAYCFTISPWQTVWDWMQGEPIGVRGC